MCNFVCPDILQSLQGFRRLFAVPISKSHDANATPEEQKLGRERSLELTARTRRFVIRRTQDVLCKHLCDVAYVSLLDANIYRPQQLTLCCLHVPAVRPPAVRPASDDPSIAGLHIRSTYRQRHQATNSPDPIDRDTEVNARY